MKSYTNLEQSEVLAKILPLESADMLFQLGEDKYADSIRVPLTKEHWEQMMPDINPCWSLASLLNELGKIKEYWFHHLIFDPTLNKYSVEVEADSWRYEGDLYDNAIDAVYEAILKLHEQLSK